MYRKKNEEIRSIGEKNKENTINKRSEKGLKTNILWILDLMRFEKNS